MNISDEQHLRDAVRDTIAALGVIEAAQGDTCVQVYAAGMALGVRNYLLRNYGSRRCFDISSELAEGSLTPILPKD